MGCDGELSCCKLETGSLIYAVINAVFWAVATISSIGLLIGINVLPKEEPYSYYDYDEYGNYLYKSLTPSPVVRTALGEVIFSVLMIICLINFLFAVLLCNGVTKRNTGHIKAYFIFGIWKAVMFSTIVIVLIMLIPPTAVLIPSIGGYCMILYMINKIIIKFSTGDIINYHNRLVAC